MSVTVHSGLLGVSIQNNPVSPGRTAARTASRSEVSTKVTVWPKRPMSRSQERKPQYMTCEATMCVGLSSASSTVVAAAMPEPNSKRLLGAFQRGDQVFGLLHRDIVGAAIDMARAIAVVGIAQIGRRHVDRRDDPARDRIAARRAPERPASASKSGTWSGRPCPISNWTGLQEFPAAWQDSSRHG